MKRKKNVCVITSSRADYSHLYPLMTKLRESKKINLKTVVTGMHLLKEYGYTYKYLEKDKFKINLRVPSKQTSTEPSKILNAMSSQIKQNIKLINLNPDAVILLGDRYDIYPFSLICHFNRIPVIHLHGGETTRGAIDDQIRDSISLFSNLHFVAHRTFAEKLCRLGINKDNICNYGTLGLETIKETKKIKKSDILTQVGFNNLSNYFLVCVHPETASAKSRSIINCVLNSLMEFKDHGIIFTGVNSDTESSIIKKSILRFVEKNKRCRYIESAGRELYVNLLRHASALIGNSSSGIIEAPYLKTPSVNVGDRQDGRPLASSIISVNTVKAEITKAVKRILVDKPTINYGRVYYDTNKTSEKMIKKIEEFISN